MDCRIHKSVHTEVVTKNDNKYKKGEEFNLADLILELEFLLKLKKQGLRWVGMRYKTGQDEGLVLM